MINCSRLSDILTPGSVTIQISVTRLIATTYIVDIQKMKMKTYSAYCRLFFVLLAASVLVTLAYFNQLVPAVTEVTETLDFLSDNLTRKMWTDEYSDNFNDTHHDKSHRPETSNGTKTNIKPLVEKSPFIDPKWHINESIEYKTILWWNAPGWLKPWQQHTDMNLCEFKNCKVSFDTNDFTKSAAVVYSIGDRGMPNNPPVPANQRNTDQAWIFFTLESPVHVQRNSKAYLDPRWNNAVNWTWNYRPDSDVFSPYGYLHTRDVLPNKDYSKIFRKKTKQVAWLVSHCGSIGQRDNYVKMLQKYIDVDIFGKCGKAAPEDYMKYFSENYKFYLGFENSLCYNYITEKFFHYYPLDVVTVLRGRANYSDYFPEHSYIDTANFTSIKELGEFLKHLSDNEEEYIKYMKIKDRYEVTERNIIYRDAVCNVCEKLNNLDKHRKSYTNVGDWVGNCYTPNDLKET